MTKKIAVLALAMPMGLAGCNGVAGPSDVRTPVIYATAEQGSVLVRIDPSRTSRLPPGPRAAEAIPPTTGRSGRDLRISRAVSHPSISGIAKSVKTRSNSSLAILSKPARPESAVTTL